MKDFRSRPVLVLLAVAAAIAAAACGSGGARDIHKDDPAGARGKGAGAGNGTATAGSRIIPLSYQGSDGSKAFAGLFDKQLGKPCAFEPLGSVSVCVPPDVYTVSAEVFYDSYKSASPSLYLDPTCGTPTAIALSEDADCTKYGVIRFSGSQYATDTPSCGWSANPAGLAVVTPVPAGTKVYAWGQGGGQCCDCAEWVPPSSGNYRAYAVETSPDETKLNLKLVTATVDYPTAP